MSRYESEGNLRLSMQPEETTAMLRAFMRLSFSAAVAAVLAGCSVAEVGDDRGGPLGLDPGLPKPMDYPIQGIDVAKYQGEIDWSAVAASGIKFAWIKATEGGDHVDERFQANWEAAKAAGVTPGAYHFVYWCRPPLEEISWFEQNAPKEAGVLPPVLDVEATPESKTCKRHLDRESAQADIKAMLEELTRYYGRKPVIYTTPDFYEAILDDGAFSDYPFWLRSTKHFPSVRYGAHPWVIWQYQADGHIPGIEGKVDRNVFNGKADQWKAFLAAR